MWGIHNTKRHWMAGLGIGLMIIMPLPLTVAAQTGTPIQYGETVSGDISDNVPCQYYWFEGAAGDSITADMVRTSGSLDGVLSLYQRDDFTADPVAFNDDRTGGGLDPLITITLTASDWYTLAACRLEHENMRITVGTFSLTLTGSAGETVFEEEASDGGAVPTAGPSITEGIFPSESDDQPDAVPTPAPSGTITEGIFSDTEPDDTGELIEDGQVISGQLDSNVPQVDYRLDVESGDQVAIHWRQTSGDLAPQIMVTNDEGELIAMASTDVIASTLQLVFVAPDDGPVGIVIVRYGEAVEPTAGAYEIVVAITPEAS